jgi:hypothetical protein
MEPQITPQDDQTAPATIQPTANIPAPTEDPGKTLGIVGLILGVIGFALVGLILCIVANKKSKAVGIKNTIAIVGIWINSVLLILGTLFVLLLVASIPALERNQAEMQQRQEDAQIQYEKDIQQAAQNQQQ